MNVVFDFLKYNTLYERCVMASVTHAIMVGKYNLLASEQSWDGVNYNFQNMEGVRGVISFIEGDYICVTQNNDENEDDIEQRVLELLRGANAKILKLAEEAGVDLVKIAPTAKPPVCKIVDYGKYKYELTRKEKEAKKKQKVIEVKEIRLSPNIDTNDLNTKVNAARKFLAKGDRVKVTLRFRGREMAHMASSKHILDDFAEALKDVCVVEKAPKVEGRAMTMFLTEKR